MMAKDGYSKFLWTLVIWYEKVSACTLREIKSVRDTIKFYENEILNYFNPNRSLESHGYRMSVKHANLCHCVIAPRLF